MAADRQANGPAPRLGIFGQTPFAVYWTGGFVSNVGTWLQAVAASIFVYEATQDVLMVGVLNFATFLPIILFSVYGGGLADRLDRRRIVIVTNILSGLIALALGVLTLAGHATPAMVIVTGFLINSVYAITKPSLVSLLSAVVSREDLSEAVSLNTLQFTIGQLLGPLIATVLMATVGAAAAFMLNAVTFLGPILSMLYLVRKGIGAPTRRAQPLASTGSQASERPGSQTSESVFRYIRERPWISAMLVGVVASSALFEVLRTLSPALAVEQLHLQEHDAGILVAAQSLGSALGVLAFVPLQRRGLAPQVAPIALGLQALGLLMATTASTLVGGMVAGVTVGVGFSLCFPYLTSTLQLGVPDERRGRVMAVHQVAHLGSRPFTALAAGVIAASFGLPAALIVAAAVTPIGLVCIRRATGLVRQDPEAALAT